MSALPLHRPVRVTNKPPNDGLEHDWFAHVRPAHVLAALDDEQKRQAMEVAEDALLAAGCNGPVGRYADAVVAALCGEVER